MHARMMILMSCLALAACDESSQNEAIRPGEDAVAQGVVKSISRHGLVLEDAGQIMVLSTSDMDPQAWKRLKKGDKVTLIGHKDASGADIDALMLADGTRLEFMGK